MPDLLSRPNVLCLRGLTGSGKDTLCRELISRVPAGYATKISFAAKLREDTELVMPVPTGFDGHPDRDTWERKAGFKHKMIEVANRELIKDPFRYIRALLDTIAAAPPSLLVCTDCRSMNEYRALLTTCNVWVIRIRRPSGDFDQMAFDRELEDESYHTSITNDGTPTTWFDLVNVVALTLRKLPYTR